LTVNHDCDIIDEVCQSFNNLDLGDQAHQLQALISEMTDFDPKSLQFEDEPKTWEEATQNDGRQDIWMN